MLTLQSPPKKSGTESSGIKVFKPSKLSPAEKNTNLLLVFSSIIIYSGI